MDMLAHSLPLPLAIDYVEEDREITTEDEGGILLALQHHHQSPPHPPLHPCLKFTKSDPGDRRRISNVGIYVYRASGQR